MEFETAINLVPIVRITLVQQNVQYPSQSPRYRDAYSGNEIEQQYFFCSCNNACAVCLTAVGVVSLSYNAAKLSCLNCILL